MKKIVTLLVLFIGLITQFCAQNKLDQTLQSYIDEEKLAGISALIYEKGKVVYQNNFGMQDLDTQKATQSNSLFRLASMTKPLTSVALMKLVEDGKIKLNDPLTKFLPIFSNLKVYNFDGEGKKLNKPITIKHLLMHTSGIGAGLLNTPVDKMIKEHDFSEIKTLDDYVSQFSQFPLVHQPGEGFTYSVSTDILARIIEIVTRQPFDQYLKENVLIPLKMNDTFFELPEEKIGRMTSIYSNKNGELKKVAGPRERLASFPRGNTGLISTPEDYLRFSKMLLNEGKLDGVRILKKKNVALMTKDHLPSSLFPIDPLGFPVNKSGFGLGVSIVNRDGEPWTSEEMGLGNIGNLPEGSFYWLGALHTFFWIDPGNEIIGIIMSQSPDIGRVDVFQSFFQGFYEKYFEKMR